MRSLSNNAGAGAAVSGGKTTPCCSKVGLKRGPWTPEEDELLSSYINREGEGRWRTLPKSAGLLRCGKSCRLRWMNYLRPSVKRGRIAPDEEDLILRLHRLLGNRWSLIAGRIPGRTDNEIKNYWNTHLSKKLIGQGIDPRSHKPLKQTDNGNNFESPHADSTATKYHSTTKQSINNLNRASSASPNSDPTSTVSKTEEISNADQFEDGFTINNLLLPKSTHKFHSYEVEDDINTDDAFSSFLNSLINDEATAVSHHGLLNQQLQLDGASSSSAPALVMSNPIPALGLSWESAIMSSPLSQRHNTEPVEGVDNHSSKAHAEHHI
ncbi:hypothetical protein SAY87_013622 [Trapa incisa]|uniref:Uncharacterized protein n=1 Tax=Trapa incisa TaxID=236973 RepID=A0AAN7KBT8_9MYRT|nr:hypothetical protein SAY87_013622 [Trapa incisa]